MNADKSLNKIDPAGVNAGQEPEQKKENPTERQETQEQAEQADIQNQKKKDSPHSEEDQARIQEMTQRHLEWEKLIQSQRSGYGSGAMLPAAGKVMRVFPKGKSAGAMLGMIKQVSDDGKSVIVQLVNGSYYSFDLTDLQINKSSLIQFLVQKAKRRAVGEVYTQPSGKKVKKVAPNKFVEVKGKAQPKEKSKVHAAVKDQQSLNFAKQSNIKPEKEVKPVNRGTELKSHTVTGTTTEKASQTVTTGIKTHVGEVHHEMNTSHLNPKQAGDAKEIYEKLKTLPESELRTRLERLKKLPNNGGAAGITAINHILNKPQVSSENKTEVQEKVTGVNKVDDKPDSKPVSEEHAKRQKLDKVREAVKNRKAVSEIDSFVSENNMTKENISANQIKYSIKKDIGEYEGEVFIIHDKDSGKYRVGMKSPEPTGIRSDKIESTVKTIESFANIKDALNKAKFKIAEMEIYSQHFIDEAEPVKSDTAEKEVKASETVSDSNDMNTSGESKLSQKELDFISDRLYALNKEVKKYRGSRFAPDVEKREELYDIKNKIIKKIGNPTGKMHAFTKGYGNEYSINGDDSFHDYHRNYNTFLEEKTKIAFKNKEVKKIVKEIKNNNFQLIFLNDGYSFVLQDNSDDYDEIRENEKREYYKLLTKVLKDKTGYMEVYDLDKLPNIGNISSELKEDTKPISDDEIEYLRTIANSENITKSLLLYKSNFIHFLVKKKKQVRPV